jgi:hypothetical protein
MYSLDLYDASTAASVNNAFDVFVVGFEQLQIFGGQNFVKGVV